MSKQESDSTEKLTNGVKTVRAMCLTKELVEYFSDSQLTRDKPSLRKKCVEVQKKMREWLLTPDKFHEAILARYTSALKLK